MKRSLPDDYLERTYAAVLGKVVGVYMGRPFEGWTHERIAAELGAIWHYVNRKVCKPLVVADDDISGTFTFIRALDDYDLQEIGSGEELSRNVGRTWLNYIVPEKSILWWGGIGGSTEHTAFARLASGIPAPESGSIARNGPVVAQQIGAQIFIDGWGMVCPGDPERAAWFAGQAGRVSHDGEAVHAAQVVAALVALGYTEPSMEKMLDGALSLIPAESLIRRVFDELSNIRAQSSNWLDGYQYLLENHGYDRYKGDCHVIPNHGLILMTLLYAPDSFQQSQMIVNTAGWDTDCNAANVGCIMGAHLGLAAFDEGVDYLGPVADRMYVPTADGGRCITDAARETVEMVNRGRRLAGQEPIEPKDGARFHFELPGSLQGFTAVVGDDWSASLRLTNTAGHSSTGTRALEVAYAGVGPGQGIAVATETLPPAGVYNTPGYAITASPIVYSGQTLRAGLSAPADQPSGEATLSVCLFAEVLRPAAGDPEEDELVWLRSPSRPLAAAGDLTLEWRVPDTGGYPIQRIGVEARCPGDETPGIVGELAAGSRRACPASGRLFLDYLRIDGAPAIALHKPSAGMETQWLRQWVSSFDKVESWRPLLGLVQNDGTGTFTTGTQEWHDYRVRATITPRFFSEGGIIIHARGMLHYLAAILRSDGTAALLEVYDAVREIISAPVEFEWESPTAIEVTVERDQLRATIAGAELSGRIAEPRLAAAGGAGIVITEGSILLNEFLVEPSGTK